MPHTFNPKHAHHCDSIFRKVFFLPKKILHIIGLKSDDIFCDIGAGTGFFAIPASAIVTNGRVIAVDTQEAMLQLLSHKIKEKNITNIELIVSKPDNPGLPAHSATLAFLSFVLHEVDNKKKILEYIHTALSKGGRIAIIEFNRYALFGPPRNERIYPEDLHKLLEETGFKGIVLKKLTIGTYLAMAVKSQ